MALDMHKTAPQVREMTLRLRDAHDARQTRLDRAVTLLGQPLARPHGPLAEETLRQRVEAAGHPRPRVTFLVAGLPAPIAVAAPIGLAAPFVLADGLHRAFAAPPAPPEYMALATDGSQITVDRHGPAHCFVINVGGAAIQYGREPHADLFSEPRLYSTPEEMVIPDPDGGVRDQPIDDVLLGVTRTVMECQALADRLEQSAHESPVLALLDGSLVRWDLSGSRYGDHVRRELLQDGFLAALDRIRAVAQRRRVAFASYISSPRSTEVVNILRVAWCPHEGVETKGCDNICGRGGPGKRECDDVATALMDRDLFERVLAPGERSEIFASQSPIVREYGPHEVRFCYVNVDGEIARLEMPEWVAQDDEAVGLLHALTLDQCRKGGGYPVALREAHEAAVVTGSDRRLFWGLVESSLAGQGLTPRLSEKARSKQVRAL